VESDRLALVTTIFESLVAHLECGRHQFDAIFLEKAVRQITARVNYQSNFHLTDLPLMSAL
jgi:hypothetical protein